MGQNLFRARDEDVYGPEWRYATRELLQIITVNRMRIMINDGLNEDII